MSSLEEILNPMDHTHQQHEKIIATNEEVYEPPYVLSYKEENGDDDDNEERIMNKNKKMNTMDNENNENMRRKNVMNQHHHQRKGVVVATATVSSSSRKQQRRKKMEQYNNKNNRNNNHNQNADTNTNNLITHRINQMKHLATDGPLIFRALSFTGGLAIILLSAWESLFLSTTSSTSSSSSSSTLHQNGYFFFKNHFKAILNFIHSCFSILTFLSGFLFCLFEIQLWFQNRCIKNGRRILYHSLPFMKFLFGRGILFFIVGVLEIVFLSSTTSSGSSQQQQHGDFVRIGVGFYMILIGFLSMVVGRHAGKKYKQIQKMILDEYMLKQTFYEIANNNNTRDECTLDDTRNNTTMNYSHFVIFLRDGVGIQLSPKEFRSAFREISGGKRSNYDSRDNGEVLISYIQFKDWWDQFHVEETMLLSYSNNDTEEDLYSNDFLNRFM